MKARSGQIAVFLVAVLLAIAVLAFANVQIFLAVRSRIRATNAADAAALAVAREQGLLINRIGRLNVDHLKAAIDGDRGRCESIVLEQKRLSFLGPLEGLRIGNDYARKNGAPEFSAAKGLLSDHAEEVESLYASNPDLYPEPFEGAWLLYASVLRTASANVFYAYPNNIDFIDLPHHACLYNKNFYFAIEGRVWCWFKYNMPGLLERYSGFRDWGVLLTNDAEERLRRSVNSEIYSLGLSLRRGSALALFGVKTISRLTGVAETVVEDASLLADREQEWFFYDQEVWGKWTNLSPDSPVRFPAAGPVRPEYDVRGAGASVAVLAETIDVFGDFGVADVPGPVAEAKSLGALSDRDDRGSLTSCGYFAIGGITDVRLVPRGSLRLDMNLTADTADEEWMHHIRRQGVRKESHVESYLKNGPNRLSNCYYCRQLVQWEKASFRSIGRNWLKFHSSDCDVPGSGPYEGEGGTPYGN